MKQCVRCSSELCETDVVCPRCGLPIEEHSIKNRKKKNRLEKKEEKRQKKLAKKAAKKQKYVSSTEFEKFAETDGMTKKQKQDALSFDVDENGEFEIDTADVEIVDKETQEYLEKREKQTYSVKKARGEYREPKIKWWEIYKLANRSFARRKIKKEVNKAAKIKPDFVSKSKLLLLAIFFGWCGAHNFYAKNKPKGVFTLVCLVLWIGIVALAPSSAFFASIQLSVAGCAGFIVIMLWLNDIINIIFNSFKYRVQKIAFISKMNVQTRAKLGEKYIDMELYQKPWWTRLKVWLEKKRRDYAEFRHERRQKMIEKEKAKQAKAAEKAKIEAEIADFEHKENEKMSKQKIIDAIDKDALKEIKEIDEVSKTEEKSNDEPKQYAKKREAKVKAQSKKNKK